MRSLILFSSAIFFSQMLFAQLTISRMHGVELANGESFEGKSLVYNDDVFKLDSHEHESSDVQFFRNAHGYFSNLAFVGQAHDGKFAMRIKKGKLDLYEKIDMKFYGAKELTVQEQTGVSMYASLASGQNFDFYCMDGIHIKKADYENLRIDLASNPESMESLYMFRRYQWLQRGLVMVGSGLLVGGLLSQGAGPVFTPIMAFGVVLGGSSLFCRGAKDDYLWNSVEIYNKSN